MHPTKPPDSLQFGKFNLPINKTCLIMGILNVTADSFSGDGLLATPRSIIKMADEMVGNGADVLDIGGETAGTSRGIISTQEEIDRTAPWIEKIRQILDIPISINSWRYEVVQAALQAGAVLVNDISGLSDPRLAKLAAEFQAGLVIMHLRGRPKEPHLHEEYADIIQEMIHFFEERIAQATQLGLRADQLLLDPGIDFAKQLHHNLLILNRLSQLTTALPYPWLGAISRKTVVGEVLDNQPPQERDPGTAALTAVACLGGCHMVRVHHVIGMHDVVKTIDAIRHPRHNQGPTA